MANEIKWNGALLGGAFGALLAFFVQKQFVSMWSGIGSLSDKVIASWSGFSSLATDAVSYTIFVIVGIIIGLYIEYQ